MVMGENWIAIKTIELHWRNRTKSRHQVNRIATTRIDQTTTTMLPIENFESRCKNSVLAPSTKMYVSKCTWGFAELPLAWKRWWKGIKRWRAKMPHTQKHCTELYRKRCRTKHRLLLLKRRCRKGIRHTIGSEKCLWKVDREEYDRRRNDKR